MIRPSSSANLAAFRAGNRTRASIFFALFALVALVALPPQLATAASSEPTLSRENNLQWKTLGENVAYIRFGKFTVGMETDIRRACTELQKKKPNGVILDLRESDGGRYQTVDDILECFLPQKFPFMKTVSDFGKVLQTTDQKPIFKKSQPVVLVMNERTANEAKILISVLQEYHKAQVLQEMPNEPTPSSQFLESPRMRDYVAIKSGFVIRPNDRLLRTNNRRDLSTGDGTLSQALKMIRDGSPWLRPTSSARP